MAWPVKPANGTPSTPAMHQPHLSMARAAAQATTITQLAAAAAAADNNDSQSRTQHFFGPVCHGSSLANRRISQAGIVPVPFLG